MNNQITIMDNIKKVIYTIRGVQVMLDSDLAELYHVEIRRLNEQVKRNIERFPEKFMFQLTNKEFEILQSQFVTGHNSLKSQFATLEKGRGKHRKYLPYVFTEQGVSMLSAVLRSKTAIKVSIQIINAFVAIRKFISANAQIFQRLDKVEIKQIEYDQNFEKVFNALETHEKKQGIFYNGQIFDAYNFISDLIRNAKKSIILIDNYVDDSVLTLFSKRKKSVEVLIFTKNISFHESKTTFQTHGKTIHT